MRFEHLERLEKVVQTGRVKRLNIALGHMLMKERERGKFFICLTLIAWCFLDRSLDFVENATVKCINLINPEYLAGINEKTVQALFVKSMDAVRRLMRIRGKSVNDVIRSVLENNGWLNQYFHEKILITAMMPFLLTCYEDDLGVAHHLAKPEWKDVLDAVYMVDIHILQLYHDSKPYSTEHIQQLSDSMTKQNNAAETKNESNNTSKNKKKKYLKMQSKRSTV